MGLENHVVFDYTSEFISVRTRIRKPPRGYFIYLAQETTMKKSKNNPRLLFSSPAPSPSPRDHTFSEALLRRTGAQVQLSWKPPEAHASWAEALRFPHIFKHLLPAPQPLHPLAGVCWGWRRAPELTMQQQAQHPAAFHAPAGQNHPAMESPPEGREHGSPGAQEESLENQVTHPIPSLPPECPASPVCSPHLSPHHPDVALEKPVTTANQTATPNWQLGSVWKPFRQAKTWQQLRQDSLTTQQGYGQRGNLVFPHGPQMLKHHPWGSTWSAPPPPSALRLPASSPKSSSHRC